MTSIDFDEVAMKTWVDETWTETITLRAWWQALVDVGLAFPAWPEAWGGRGVGRNELRQRNAVLTEAGTFGPPTGLGVLMGAPVVMQFGTDDQKARFLPPLANGTESWCQLFSEPDAGSDLASVTTTAVRDGDEWIINGQKIWTSGAVEAARGMLIARTDPDQPKHRGIGYFIIDMDQPGIDVRAIHQMNGESHFNEVFFTDARVADADRIDEPDRGWAVAVATLGFERAGLGDSTTPSGLRPPAGERAGYLDLTVAEVRTRMAADSGPPVESIADSNTLIELAKRWDRMTPTLRADLTDLYLRGRISGWLQTRTAQLGKAGLDAGRIGALLKLDWTERLRVARDVAMAIGGSAALAVDPTRAREDTAAIRALVNLTLSIPSASIAGGSDEVQRNIIAERVLGLPKDVAVDRSTAFKDRLRGGHA